MKPSKLIFFFLLSFVATFVLAALALAGTGWWLLQPVSPNSDEMVTFEIPRGTSQNRIAENLANQGLIKNPLSFRLAVRALGVGSQLQAGIYQISPSQSAIDIANTLTRNTSDLRVTLPEGLRAEEVVEILQTELNISTENMAGEEYCLSQNGYLYPETYSFVPGSTLQAACERLRSEFDRQWTSLTAEKSLPTGYTQAELVTLAALVQREARDPQDMRRVAGVLFNRLEIGMPLQIDATLQYAKGYDANRSTWWPVPLAADKDLSSPYNTYQNAGLPAGPIANPGRDALSAVLNPIASENLYYISTLDGSEMYFTETYEEHLQNIDRYLR